MQEGISIVQYLLGQGAMAFDKGQHVLSPFYDKQGVGGGGVFPAQIPMGSELE